MDMEGDMDFLFLVNWVLKDLPGIITYYLTAMCLKIMYPLLVWCEMCYDNYYAWLNINLNRNYFKYNVILINIIN